MTVSINNPLEATYIFIAIFIAAMIFSVRRGKIGGLFSESLTQELKGVAILAVVFSHIGYFLVDDHRFLHPLTIMAGVGVNLFLFLSGYGLTASSLKKNYSIGQFYRRRLAKLYLPLWLVLAIFFFLDFFILKHFYGWDYIVRSAIGFFPKADLYQDVNSPLWYITIILFYYLVFPLAFSRKRPLLSAIIIYGSTYLILQQDFMWLNDVVRLYEVHTIAFPLGMILAYLFQKPQIFTGFFKEYLANKYRKLVIYYSAVLMLLFVVGYTAIYSNVGSDPQTEELTSIITVLAITFLFIMKKLEIKLLYYFGLFSYEIYLLHWPIMYHYDIFFKYMPAWLATSAYLVLFLGLGVLFKRMVKLFSV